MDVWVVILAGEVQGTAVIVCDSLETAEASMRLNYPECVAEPVPDWSNENQTLYTLTQEGYEPISVLIARETVNAVPSRVRPFNR